MIINYESPAVKIVGIFCSKVLCSSPDGSWEDVDREDDDNW